MEYGFALTKYQLNKKEYDICMCLNESRKMTGIQISQCDEHAILNNIYVGRIETIIPSIKAYFVRFSSDNICFLPFSEAIDPFYVQKNSKKNEPAIGDLILIQITREALKEKEPAASCNLSLQGKYMVLTTKDKSLSVSKKINSQKKDELINLFCEDHKAHGNYGLVIRTIAKEQSSEELLEDYESLRDMFLQLMDTYTHKNLYDQVYKEPPAYINYLKNQFNNSIEFIKSDSKDIIECLNTHLPSAKENIQYYDDTAVSLETLYNIKGNIDSLLSQKVWLKSGSNIIIEQLETLTLIDVNSAKSNGKKQDAFKVNVEALDAALEQISLRNISGMIIIDFINMNQEESAKLVSMLKEKVSKYQNPCKYIDTTKLGLIELTRKKIDRSIKEICQS